MRSNVHTFLSSLVQKIVVQSLNPLQCLGDTYLSVCCLLFRKEISVLILGFCGTTAWVHYRLKSAKRVIAMVQCIVHSSFFFSDQLASQPSLDILPQKEHNQEKHINRVAYKRIGGFSITKRISGLPIVGNLQLALINPLLHLVIVFCNLPILHLQKINAFSPSEPH